MRLLSVRVLRAFKSPLLHWLASMQLLTRPSSGHVVFSASSRTDSFSPFVWP